MVAQIHPIDQDDKRLRSGKDDRKKTEYRNNLETEIKDIREKWRSSLLPIKLSSFLMLQFTLK